MEQYNYIGIAIEELYRMFNIFNTQYYHNELTHPIITIQSSNKVDRYGWFILDPIWTKNIENPSDKDKKYEINLLPEWLNRQSLDIACTLHHEMVHYYNKINNIKDCSDKIHNQRFKYRAERVGFIVEKDSKCGWGITHPSEQLSKFIEDYVKPDMSAFQYFRQLKPKPPKKNQKKQHLNTAAYLVIKKLKEKKILI